MTKFTVEKGEKGTIWINGPYNCLGRYGIVGYEIYRALSPREDNAHAMSSGNVLATKVADIRASRKDWLNFRQLMKEHHKIELPENMDEIK